MASSSISHKIQPAGGDDHVVLTIQKRDKEYYHRLKEIESLEKLIAAEKFFIETELPKMITRHKSQMNELFLGFEKLKLAEEDGGGGVVELRRMKKLILHGRKRIFSTHSNPTTADNNNFDDNLSFSINNSNNNINNHVDYDMSEMFQKSSFFKDYKARYHELGPELKRCLLCLAAFPENAEMKRRVLIQWWIGEGFIPPVCDINKTAEHWGDLFLDELISRRFLKVTFNDQKYSSSMRVNTWTMEPSVRSVVVKLAADANFFDIDLKEGNVTEDYSRSLRSCLKMGKGLANVQDLMKLKTIFNVDETLLTLNPEWTSKMGNARVLHLGSWQATGNQQIEVLTTNSVNKMKYIHGLDGLENVKQLRLLNLESFSRIRRLPRSLSKLTDLTILNIRACHNLESLPEEIGCLENLTHLDMSECYLLEHMPIGIAKLKKIQVLKGFVVLDTKSKAGCTLLDLRGCEVLRKLALYIKMDLLEDEWDFLDILMALRSLKLTWGCPLSKQKKDKREHRNHPIDLEKLKLECLTDEVPSIFHNRSMNVKKLCLIGCNLSVKTLYEGHFFGDMSTVEELELKYMNNLWMRWSELRELFPKLKYLKMINCPGLSTFPCDENGVWIKSRTKRER